MYTYIVKRLTPRLHLTRSPLVYVVAAVRFSAVMAVEKFVPDIQEHFRHKGFPRFLKNQIPEITFVSTDTAPKLSLIERFEFQNKEANLGIVLTMNMLAIHTNTYDTYEKFEESIETALTVIHGAMQLSIAERIGLRYVDLIRLNENENWGDYLQPGLLGVDPAQVGVRKCMRKFESLGETNVGKLLIRCGQTEQPLPPDVQPSSLKYSLSLNPGEIATLLDVDHFSEQPLDFDVEAVLSRIGDLHDHVERAFVNAVTPTALVKWGNEEMR